MRYLNLEVDRKFINKVKLGFEFLIIVYLLDEYKNRNIFKLAIKWNLILFYEVQDIKIRIFSLIHLCK